MSARNVPRRAQPGTGEGQASAACKAAPSLHPDLPVAATQAHRCAHNTGDPSASHKIRSGVSNTDRAKSLYVQVTDSSPHVSEGDSEAQRGM